MGKDLVDRADAQEDSLRAHMVEDRKRIGLVSVGGVS